MRYKVMLMYSRGFYLQSFKSLHSLSLKIKQKIIERKKYFTRKEIVNENFLDNL